jgi:hypothetical protein
MVHEIIPFAAIAYSGPGEQRKSLSSFVDSLNIPRLAARLVENFSICDRFCLSISKTVVVNESFWCNEFRQMIEPLRNTGGGTGGVVHATVMDGLQTNVTAVVLGYVTHDGLVAADHQHRLATNFTCQLSQIRKLQAEPAGTIWRLSDWLLAKSAVKKRDGNSSGLPTTMCRHRISARAAECDMQPAWLRQSPAGAEECSFSILSL